MPLHLPIYVCVQVQISIFPSVCIGEGVMQLALFFLVLVRYARLIMYLVYQPPRKERGKSKQKWEKQGKRL